MPRDGDLQIPIDRRPFFRDVLALLTNMVARDAQFVIATHSPMLMAFPNATIYSFDQQSIRQVAFHEVEHVQIMKSFLESPQRYLRHL